jgi:hypothetical protein
MTKHFLFLAAGLACAGFSLTACAQQAPDQGPPPGYGSPPPGYGGPPPGYGGPPPGEMGGPPPGQMGAPPPGQMGAPPGNAPAPMAGMPAPHGPKARFEAANVTHDGRLTQAQAAAAGWHGVAKHFSEIDRDNKGYVTMQDIHAWTEAKRAARGASHAPAQPPMQGPPPGQPQ